MDVLTLLVMNLDYQKLVRDRVVARFKVEQEESEALKDPYGGEQIASQRPQEVSATM